MSDWTDATELPPVEISDQLAELRREANLRRWLYTAWIRTGRLSERKAQLQMHRLASAIATLESVRDATGD